MYLGRLTGKFRAEDPGILAPGLERAPKPTAAEFAADLPAEKPLAIELETSAHVESSQVEELKLEREKLIEDNRRLWGLVGKLRAISFKSQQKMKRLEKENAALRSDIEDGSLSVSDFLAPSKEKSRV